MHAEARNHVLTFVAAGEEYGVGVLDVREIVELSCATRMPAAAEGLRCVVSLQGRILPVVDLGMQLGLPPAPLTARSSVVVVEGGRRSETIGILAEVVRHVVDLPASAVQPPSFQWSRSGHVAAVASAGGTPIMMLDVQCLVKRIGRAAAAPVGQVVASVGLAPEAIPELVAAVA